METSLHKQLKDKFCEPGAVVEAKLGRYRIDVVNGDTLVEIQQSGLAAIRDKIQKLCDQNYDVVVVKPLVLRKRLVKLDGKNGKEVSARWSPKKGSMLDLFDELIYFTRAFPHPNLQLIVPLMEVEEVRYPGHGRRRRWRKNDFVTQDKRMIDVYDIQTFRTAADLHRLLPDDLPGEFDTQELADGLGIKRHEAQKIGYVLRKCGSAEEAGKRGRALLYRLVAANEVRREPTRKVVLDVVGRKSAKKKADVVATKKKKAVAKKAEKKKVAPKKKVASKKSASKKKAVGQEKKSARKKSVATKKTVATKKKPATKKVVTTEKAAAKKVVKKVLVNPSRKTVRKKKVVKKVRRKKVKRRKAA